MPAATFDMSYGETRKGAEPRNAQDLVELLEKQSGRRTTIAVGMQCEAGKCGNCGQK